MDFLQLVNEVKMSSDSEAKKVAASYGIELSTTEIQALRPLLDDISFHWLFTGIPKSFINKVENTIGSKKTKRLLHMYNEATQ